MGTVARKVMWPVGVRPIKKIYINEKCVTKLVSIIQISKNYVYIY